MKARTDRQDYIDWLRAGAMLLLLFFHSGRLFDGPGWHIKNAVLNPGVDAFNRFLDIWLMPLFFLIAGAAAWFALGHRPAGAFAKERTLRLFVPLLFGMLVIVPPQVYAERVFDGDFAGSFLAWYPNTFVGTYSNDNAQSGNLSWHHLWFLAYLFVFSLLLLPLLRHFRRLKGASLLLRLTGFMQRPGAIFLPAAILALINVALRPAYGWGNQNLINDWANFAYYITVFFCGFVLVSDGRMLQTVQRYRYAGLAAAVVLSAAIPLGDGGLIPVPGAPVLAFQGIACWCWLIAIVGIGSRLLNFKHRVLRYANDAVLPVYILHQTIIVTLGFYVVQWDAGVAPKYFLTVLATLAMSLAIYELVRRTRVTRFLFGIKSPRSAAPPEPATNR